MHLMELCRVSLSSKEFIGRLVHACSLVHVCIVHDGGIQLLKVGIVRGGLFPGRR